MFVHTIYTYVCHFSFLFSGLNIHTKQTKKKKTREERNCKNAKYFKYFSTIIIIIFSLFYIQVGMYRYIVFSRHQTEYNYVFKIKQNNLLKYLYNHFTLFHENVFVCMIYSDMYLRKLYTILYV